MQKRQVQKIVAAAVVIDKMQPDKEGIKVLIVKRRPDADAYPDIWELPSGKIEFGEHPDKTVLREVKEETNMEVSIMGIVSCFDYLVEKPDKSRHTVQINYIAENTQESQVKISDEHVDYAWIQRSEIGSYDLTDSVKQVLQKAFRFLEHLEAVKNRSDLDETKTSCFNRDG